ncbi:MAG: glycosyltransferase family protein [Candidatus Auribacterota bacterium]|jgi:uncharacterized protein (TIGR00661 family)|nr:glycosyltransferase family protein [Candidatus Auribacterota bacterium]
MKKKTVVYAVAGEGRGHAGRAIGIVEQLKGEIDFHFICGGKAYELLKPMGYSLMKIPFLGFVYENDSISQWKTLKENLMLYLRRKNIYAQIEQRVNEIKPDFIITDFEYFLPRVARKMRIPHINITHQHVLLACTYPVPLKLYFDYLKAYIVSRMIILDSPMSIGISFFSMPLKKSYRNILNILGPILRKEVVQAKPVLGDKNLVYFSCETFAWVTELLKQIKNEQFLIYGLGDQPRKDANLEYKPISPTVFLDDLIECKAVITNGGHTLVSEAIHLNKPVLAFYVKGQFEQFLNAFYLDELGYGKRIKSDANALQEMKDFLKNAPALAKHLEKIEISGNKEVVSYLRSIIIGKDAERAHKTSE